MAFRINPWTGQPDYSLTPANANPDYLKMEGWGASAPTNTNSIGSGISDINTNGLGFDYTPVGGTDPSFMQQWITGYKDGNQFIPGVGQMALGAASGLGNLYLGFQQYGLAKQALAQSKDQWNKNYAAQAQMTNASLADRDRARNAATGGQYAYNDLAKYGLKA